MTIKKQKMKNIISAIVCITIIASCNNSKKTTVANAVKNSGSGSEMLYQFQWNLTELQGVTVPSAAKAYMLLSPGKVNNVTGNTGCNIMKGSFELIETNGIKFSPFATTKRACLDNSISNMEQKFLDALSSSSNWIIKDTVLLLSNDKTTLAKLRGVAAEQ